MAGKKAGTNNKTLIRRITITGMLFAIMLLFTFTPIGFIRLGPIAATLMHLPVLIALSLMGVGTGMILGLAFGVLSMTNAFLTPTVTSFLFMNPLIAVVPRVLFPLIGYCARGISLKFTKREYLADATGAFVGTAMNTLLVLSLIWIIYAQRYAEVIGISEAGIGAALGLTALTNGLPEAILAAVLVPAITTSLRRSGIVK